MLIYRQRETYDMRTLLLLLLPFFCQAQVVQKNLTIVPIVDGVYPQTFVQDFRVTYKDSGRCTDESFIELITDSGTAYLKPIRFKVSCDIVSWGRADDEAIQLLRNNELRFVRILNPQTNHIYYYKIEQPRGLQRILREQKY